MGKIKKGLGYVVAVEQYVCCALLVVMLSICFVAVVMRYAFNSPIVWSEEVILTCLIWFGFMCISIGIYRDDHIAIEGVFNKLPPLARKALTVFRHVLLMVFCMFMTYLRLTCRNAFLQHTGPRDSSISPWCLAASS